MKTRILLHSPEGRKLVGIGCEAMLTLHEGLSAQAIDEFMETTSDRTRFVALSYDAGRFLLEDAYQSTADLRFPVLMLWVPESLYRETGGELVLTEGSDNDENRQTALMCIKSGKEETPRVQWQALRPKTEYIASVERLKQHIRRGDIYETNFCQEFYARDVQLPDGAAVFHKLDEAARAPFAAYFENDDWMIASASPERFFRKEGKRIFSQPIKGTAPRGRDPEEDGKNRGDLASSEKDKAENVMIVDLVRNDLSRIAEKASVNVDELFGIYTFPTVHQMISTVSCSVRDNVRFSDLLAALFPMGSMTGAPKISAVRLSDCFEGFNRGIYSGSLGFISPREEIIDMNVVIRTLVYDKTNRRLSCPVGGAITMASDPEAEYEECRTKVGRILEIFGTCRW
jgi:para-aminobenzoate synthetase component I